MKQRNISPPLGWHQSVRHIMRHTVPDFGPGAGVPAGTPAPMLLG
jgi:hypothetical protein